MSLILLDKEFFFFQQHILVLNIYLINIKLYLIVHNKTIICKIKIEET